MKNQFWYNADWKAYSCCARHPIGNVVEYIFLAPVRLRVKLMTQRQREGGNKFFNFWDK